MSEVLLVSVNVGLAREMQMRGRTVRSAISKQAVDGAVAVTLDGLQGDEQADTRLHGGPSKAVYAYPQEHFPFWRTVRAQARVSLWDEALPPGALGENLTLLGLLEAQAWIGDLLRFPDCTLAVSEPRTPCGKLNAALGFDHAVRMMAQSGWCGFYLSVREPGTLAAGQRGIVVPGPREVSIAELFKK